MDGRMLKILTFITDMGKMFEVTLGQGHKFKGQGHLCTYINMCFWLKKSTTDGRMMITLTHITEIC